MRTAVKRKQDMPTAQCSKQRRDAPNLGLQTTVAGDINVISSPFDRNSEYRSPHVSHWPPMDEAERLRQVLDAELNESMKFEKHLARMMTEMESPVTDCAAAVQQNVSRRSSLAECSWITLNDIPRTISNDRSLNGQMERLYAELNSEKDADRLFEIQLMNAML